eukprot:m.107438 g.107438  ORF g.107438 m.107438 type:complete len:138 (-) comp13928_c0_seq1:264-677(-)
MYSMLFNMCVRHLQDTIRHYKTLFSGILQMIHALSDTARTPPPAPTNHLLLSLPFGVGSVAKKVQYKSAGSVEYTTSGVPSTDRLRLSFTPTTVSAGTTKLPQKDNDQCASPGCWTFDSKTGVLVVTHTIATDVSIE